MDGNKRTAYEAADVFLRQNGYEIDVEGEELVGTMVGVARGRFALPDIADWVRRNLRKV